MWCLATHFNRLMCVVHVRRRRRRRPFLSCLVRVWSNMHTTRRLKTSRMSSGILCACWHRLDSPGYLNLLASKLRWPMICEHDLNYTSGPVLGVSSWLNTTRRLPNANCRRRAHPAHPRGRKEQKGSLTWPLHAIHCRNSGDRFPRIGLAIGQLLNKMFTLMYRFFSPKYPRKRVL